MTAVDKILAAKLYLYFILDHAHNWSYLVYTQRNRYVLLRWISRSMKPCARRLLCIYVNVVITIVFMREESQIWRRTCFKVKMLYARNIWRTYFSVKRLYVFSHLFIHICIQGVRFVRDQTKSDDRLGQTKKKSPLPFCKIRNNY